MFYSHRRRPAATVLAVALCSSLLLSGCSAGHTATSPSDVSPADTITVGATTAPASLDFTTTSGAAIPQALMGNVYEGLVRIDQNGEVAPLLATSWDTSEDGRVYTFHLRQGVRFSNGDPFNADAAKFSIDRVLSDAWTNGLKAQMAKVESTRVIDEHTLEVTLTQRSNTWLWTMGTLIGAMMSPTGVDDLANNPVGTGPFIVENWAVGSSLSMTRNEDYWGDTPTARRAVLRYFSDAISMTNAVRAGDIDIAVGLQNPELLDSLAEQDDLQIEVGTTNGEVLLSMNNQRAPFNDVRVRQAVMYGIDRQGLIDAAWDGYGLDTGGTPVPPTDPWYTGTSQYSFDPDKARQLMQEAGAVGTPITISVPSLPYAQVASEMIYSQLRDIGFEVSIESTEFPAVWLAKVLKGKDYDMSIVAHVEPRDIPTLFGNPDYYLGFDDEQVQQLLAQADSAPAEQYTPLMREAVARIMDQAAADTVFNLPNIVVARTGIDNIPVNSVSDGLALAPVSKQGATK